MEDTILYDKRRRKKLLIKIVLVYLIVGAFWIFFSDIIAAALAPSQEVLTRIQMIKGWLYILANALLLFYLLGRGLKELELSRETVRLYEMLAARSRDIILLVRSKDGKILEANSAASTAYGYDRETLLAMTIHDLRAPEAQGLVPEQLQIVETEGILFESVHKRRDGSVFPVEVSSRGAIIYHNRVLISIIRDITERRQAERQVNEFLKEITILNRVGNLVNIGISQEDVVHSAIEGIAGTMSPDVIMFFLKETDRLQLRGCNTKESVLGQDQVPIHKLGEWFCGLAASEGVPVYSHDVSEDPRCTWDECRQSGIVSFAALPMTENQNVIGILGLASLTPYDFSKQASFLETLTSSIAGALSKSLLLDQITKHAVALEKEIADRKRAEEEKEILEAQLRQAQKMESLGTLAGGIAHDFNNILAIIMGCAEMVALDIDAESKQGRMLAKVINASRRAKDLVKQILAFSRRSEQEKRPVRIDLLLDEALKLLRATLPTTIELKAELNSKAVVCADPTQIHQVIMNLCTNSAQAMPGEGGAIYIGLNDSFQPARDHLHHPDLPPGAYVELTVKDTGQGIEPTILDRLFDPFFTTKEKGVGTGLGLSVVHGIVKSHGGAIEVSSTYGKGTSFRVLFPVVESLPIAEPEDDQAIAGGRERILLVDDEPAIAEAAKQMLEYLGYEVDSKTSGGEALKSFRRQQEQRPFQLVITDMTMPHMTGADLAREVHRLDATVPVILCTGYNESVKADTVVRDLGIQALLMKPYDLKQLSVLVRSVLDTKNHQARLDGKPLNGVGQLP